MKKILFVLPFSALLTFCSSSKQAQVVNPGISNMQVNGTTATTTPIADNNGRDWGYTAVRDTALSGSWQLLGMLTASEGWKDAEAWMPKDSTANADSATMGMDSAAATNNAAIQKTILSNSPQTASAKKTFGSAMYDTSVHFFDTAAFKQTLADRIQPYAYWQRLPQINIMPALGIFTGNTGCNSMSGSFNFSGSDIKFDDRIRTSKMACNDYDESALVAHLLQADNYVINSDVLELKKGSTTLITFKRKV